jgi:hypothetical protein
MAIGSKKDSATRYHESEKLEGYMYHYVVVIEPLHNFTVHIDCYWLSPSAYAKAGEIRFHHRIRAIYIDRLVNVPYANVRWADTER